jgi:hypothetical protein
MENTKTETVFLMESKYPIAGRGEVHTKEEWKKIYGYEVGYVVNAKFTKQELVKA